MTWAFLPSLKGDFIEFDDGIYVTENSHLAFNLPNLVWESTHAEAGNWHPLTMWSLMLDHQLYGLQAWGYHLTSVLVHAINTVLVFLLLRRMTGTTWRSLMVAALFGLHPLRVESVAWISERKDVLSVLFWLLALWAWARYAEKSGIQGPKSKVFYGLALVFFALGLMSKPMVVTLPFVLLLLDYWPLQRWSRLSLLKLLMEKVPFFCLSAALCVVTYVAQRNAGVMKDLAGLTLGARLENALVAYGRYLGKLFWPADLCALYPHPGHWPALRILSAAFLVLGVSMFVFSLRRNCPYLLIGWCWYLGTLVPVIGLVQVGSESMSDRYSYFPSIGILIALVWGTHQLTKTWSSRKTGLSVASWALILISIGLTRHQISYWTDTATVCRRAIAVTEKNYDAHSRLGRALFSPEHLDEAIDEFQAALKARPDYVEAYCGLGRAYAVKGQKEAAMACYQKALEFQPDSVVAHNNLSDLLFHNGRMDEAMDHARKALSIEPGNVTALNNLASALMLQGKMAEALGCYQKAAALQPDNAVVQNNLGSALLRGGRMEEAVVYFQHSLAIESNNVTALNNLGYALYSLGRFDAAARAYQETVRLQPAGAEAHRNLAYVLVQCGQLDEAIGEFQTALQLKRDYVTASNELVMAIGIREQLARQTNGPTNR